MEPLAITPSHPFPHVNVLFWKHEEVKLCHVALQILFPNQDEIYVSFWHESSTEQHQQSCGNQFHFHRSCAEDQRFLGPATQKIELYSLKIEPLTAAYRKFRENPDGRGSLGYGIFSRAYPKTAIGLTWHLLEKGGIYRLAPSYNNGTYARIFRIMAIVAPLFTVFNCYSIYQMLRIEIPLSKEEGSEGVEGFFKCIPDTSQLCKAGFKKLKSIHKELFAVHNSLEGVSKTQELRQKCLDAISMVQIASHSLKRPPKGFETAGVIIFQTPTRALAQVSQRIIFISLYGVIPTFLCITGLWLKHRFFQHELNFKELQIIATKAQKTDRRLLYQKLTS